MIGQTPILESLAREANSAKLMNSIPRHIAFEASRGMGKSAFMNYTAELFGFSPIATAFKRGTQMDKSVSSLRSQWRKGSGWLIDELHNASMPNQMALKKLLETGVYTTNSGDNIRISGLFVITAFTDRSAIDEELLDRFSLYRLLPYSFNERMEILNSYASKRQVNLSIDDAEWIVTKNESPRDIEKAIDDAVTLQNNGIKVTSEAVFAHRGKDADGLDNADHRALLIVAELLGKQVKATLEILSVRLRLTPKATNQLLSRLSSLGYLKTAPGIGRTLTAEGWDKVDELRDRGME